VVTQCPFPHFPIVDISKSYDLEPYLQAHQVFPPRPQKIVKLLVIDISCHSQLLLEPWRSWKWFLENLKRTMPLQHLPCNIIRVQLHKMKTLLLILRWGQLTLGWPTTSPNTRPATILNMTTGNHGLDTLWGILDLPHSLPMTRIGQPQYFDASKGSQQGIYYI
jgi:hypothetical protein